MKKDYRYTMCGIAGAKRAVPHIFFITLLLATASAGFTSCKTTVKNYKDAYDVALRKQAREDSLRLERQREMGLGNGRLAQDADGFVSERRGDMQYYMLRKLFQRKDSVGAYAAAVGAFKMQANASSMSEDLRVAGFPDARAAESGEMYYVLIGSASDSDTALDLLERFGRKNRDWRYVGVPGPTLIVGSGR